MLNERELLDRFGDVEFLHELWRKARSELPERLQTAGRLARGEQAASNEELAKQLHKLRGLISNFLTERTAVPLLIQCEKAVEENRLEELAFLWQEFETAVKGEVARLDGWLEERGYRP